MQSITRHIIAGVLTIIPLTVTVWIIWFIVQTLIRIGKPGTIALSRLLRPGTPDLADFLLTTGFQSGAAFFIAVIGLYLLGRITKMVLGRRMFLMIERIVDRLPLARTIYGATQTLIKSLGGDGTTAGQHVVLIEFPSEHMRAVGIVTRIFPKQDGQPELAAVYVPTTPNPTSGYVEIVPTERLIWLGWSKNDAMAFIVSGGAMIPENIPIDWHSAGIRKTTPLQSAPAP